jgi:23S rRNA (guanine745-N1)-methyltransferase
MTRCRRAWRSTSSSATRDRSVLSDVVDLLRCPHCRVEMQLDGRVLRCGSGHSFDVARQGYVNLLPRRPATGTGDTSTMVAARTSFLSGGHYSRFADAVAAATSDPTDGSDGSEVGLGEPIAEVGAGTGYYLAQALHRRDGVGVAIDVSTAAARRAAHAHERIGSVVADAWTSLPLADACLGAAVVAFAPRSGGELARVVRPGGRLVVLVPAADHLIELRSRLGLLDVDPRKAERLAAALGDAFRSQSDSTVRWTTELDHDAVRDLVLMGPNALHQDEVRLAESIAALPEPAPVTVSGILHVLRRR